MQRYTMPRYAIQQLSDVPPIECPCGTARRAFVDEPDRVASLHVVEITADSKTHYHRELTELYYVLEGSGTIELDGTSHPLRPGVAVLIRPGCRHRAVPDPPTADAPPADDSNSAAKPLRLLNVPVPAFDAADEWFD